MHSSAAGRLLFWSQGRVRSFPELTTVLHQSPGSDLWERRQPKDAGEEGNKQCTATHGVGKPSPVSIKRQPAQVLGFLPSACTRARTHTWHIGFRGRVYEIRATRRSSERDMLDIITSIQTRAFDLLPKALPPKPSWTSSPPPKRQTLNPISKATPQLRGP